MTSRLAEAVAEKIEHAGSLYHRLVLVLGPERSENATALKDIAERIDAPLINVGLELSRRLLDLAERQRRFRVPILLERLVATSEGEIVLLDNIELLFDSTLRQDPLAVLQRLSRRRTVVATWNGPIGGRSHLLCRTRPSRVPALSCGRRSRSGCGGNGVMDREALQ